MTQAKFSLPALLALALSACQQAADDSNIMIDNNVTTAEAANAEFEAVPPSEDVATLPVNGNSALNEADDAGSEDPNQAFFPAQYRGRWGMVRADCDPKRSDNKGLITIADTTVKFYESLANLREQRPAIATSFSGMFAFTGEGQKWDKVMTFTRTGDTLKRADSDGTFTYTRC